MTRNLLRVLPVALCLLLAGLATLSLGAAEHAAAQTVSSNPGESGIGSASDVWRDIRYGQRGVTSLPDKSKGYLIQSEGEDWRQIRNNRIFFFGAAGIVAMLLALVSFYAIRGRIMLDGAPTGRKILRFKAIERYNHWVMAVSFILLALTGLNMLFGRTVLLPVMGHEAFSTLAGGGKFVHNNISWLFMVSLILTIVFWTKDNLWDRYDLNWILKGGGLFSKGVHPPSARFNFAEKSMFWLVALGGIAVSYTGLELLFPFILGDFPPLPILQLVHSGFGLVMTIAIMGHIYIGSIGMEGAFEGMSTGYVDETWAAEHHAAWAESHGVKVEHRAKDEEHVAPVGGEQTSD